MRFSFIALATAVLSGTMVAAAKPLKGWHITNENAIKNFYQVGDVWIEKKQIIDALGKAAEKKHDNSDKKKPSTKGSYPHVYTNDKGPWPQIHGSSMDHGMYFEFQLGQGQRTPDDPRVVYTIKGDPSDKVKNAGEKQPIESKFIGVMKHGEKNGPFIIVEGKDKKEEKKDDKPKEDEKKKEEEEKKKKEEEEKKKKEEEEKKKKEEEDKKKKDDDKDDDKDGKGKGKGGKGGKGGKRSAEPEPLVDRASRVVKRSYPIHFRA